jgi:hypothetical protein
MHIIGKTSATSFTTHTNLLPQVTSDHCRRDQHQNSPFFSSLLWRTTTAIILHIFSILSILLSHKTNVLPAIKRRFHLWHDVSCQI